MEIVVPKKVKPASKNLNNVNDVESLKEMLVGNKSRGQRQRINKKIDLLSGTKKEEVKPEDKKLSAKDKIDSMLKKRENKMNKKLEAH